MTAPASGVDIDEYVRQLVALAPPLDEATRSRLRLLLAMPRNDAGAARPAAPVVSADSSPAAELAEVSRAG